MKDIDPFIEYQDKIEDLNIDLIEVNQFNPRERFNEAEEDELIDSILAKGILNPIIVYKKSESNKYVIIDGERRYRACRKINIKSIPARILLREPTVIESLSLMFHVHNVREDWTEFAIALTIKRILDELGLDISGLSRYDILDLSKITSLSEYKINKYLKYLDYPEEVFNMFLDQEINSQKNEGPDPDILMEMHRPIQDMQLIMPEIFNELSVKSIIDTCIQKKADGIIKTNKEFRLIAQSLTAVKKENLSSHDLKESLLKFFSIHEYTPEQVYHESAEEHYQFKNIKKSTEAYLKQLSLFDFDNLDTQKREEVSTLLSRLLDIINRTL
jgi:ParB family chromosome partitioning protein